MLRGVFLNCFLNIVYLNTALQGVQPGDLQRFGPHVQPGDRRAFARHALGEDAAAAADIEDFFTEQAAGAFGNIAQPQRVDAVERFELALQIPPARGDGFEFGDFSMIDIRGYRRFFGIHGRFYSFSVQTCEYISSAP
ncbi:Uncharacterised protein [Klebsiella pneumoniae]|nr:Uncharacterised protein [Klebsiella pneumoniae]